MEELYCIGCGSKIQTENKEKAGYIPASKLTEEIENIVCHRCFRLRHYNEIIPSTVTTDEYYEILSSIGKEDALVIKILDLFDLEGSMMPELAKLTNHQELIILLNKRDLLPKSINDNKLMHRLKKTFSENNLKPTKVFTMSASKKYNIDEIAQYLEEHQNNRNIYVVGASNVGKSTFLNALIRSFTDIKQDVITVSQQAGTTQNVIEIPFLEKHIIDTPGLINEHQFLAYLDADAIKVLSPKKEIKPRVFQLNPGQTLFFGGLVELAYLEGNQNSFACYVNQLLSIHRTKTQRAAELKEIHQEDDFFYPKTSGDQLKTFTFRLKGDEELVFPGLGFVSIKHPGKISVTMDARITPITREKLVG
jgi:ribosome biogenesis GTPase YqeH